MQSDDLGLVDRLKLSPEKHEERMSKWDYARKLVKDGNTGSLPRDIIESIIGGLEEDAEEAAAAIERLEASNSALMAERANLIETKRQQLAAKDAEIERLKHDIASYVDANTALLAERDEARRVRRWNIDEMGGTLHVCRGEHDGDDCEWESFVPADHLRDTEAQRDKLREALKPFAKIAEEIQEVLADDKKPGLWATPTAGNFRRARQALKDAP